VEYILLGTVEIEVSVRRGEVVDESVSVGRICREREKLLEMKI